MTDYDMTGVPGVGDLEGQPYGWLDFEAEPEMTGDGAGDPEKFFLLIGEWDRGAYSDEVCTIVHRTCGGKYPLDGTIAERKRLVAQHIVKLLNDNPIDLTKEHS